MPPIIGRIMQNIWIVAAIFAAIQVLARRRRATAMVADGAVTTQDAGRFARMTAGGVALPAALALLSLRAGYPVFFCAPFLAPRTGFDAVTTALIIACWTGALIWLWFGSGSELLSRLGPRLTGLPRWTATYSPRQIRFVVTAIVLAAATAVAFMSYTTPPQPMCDRAIPSLH